MKILCKLFGHKFDLIEVTLLKIMIEAENKTSLNKTLFCKRCGAKVFWDGRTDKMKIEEKQ